MKKLLVVLALIAVAIFVVAPFITGKVVEQQSNQIIDNINSKNPQFGKLVVQSYDRGFSSSKAEYAIELAPVFKESLDSNNIEYECDIDHGIMSVSYTCKLDKTGQFKEFLDKYLDGEDPIVINGNITAAGKLDQTISIQPVTIEPEEGERVSLPKEAEINIVYDHKTKEIDFSGGVPKVLYEGQGYIDLDNLTFDGKVTEAREGLYVGNMNFSSNLFQAGDEKGLLTIDQVDLSTATIEKGDTISSSMALSSKNMEFPTPTGQIESFSDASLDMSIYGMDTDALVSYIQANKELQQNIMSASEDNNAQQQAALASMTNLIPALEKLLQQGLGINVKSSFMSEGAENAVSLDLNLLNDLQFSQLMGFLFAPDETLKNFKGELDVELKKELLEKYPQLAFAVASLPLFVQSDSGASLQARLDSGLIINGQATSVQELQGMFQ